MKNIDFNVPFMCGRELQYIEQSHRDKHLSGNGAFTRKCSVGSKTLSAVARRC